MYFFVLNLMKCEIVYIYDHNDDFYDEILTKQAIFGIKKSLARRLMLYYLVILIFSKFKNMNE